MTLASRLLAFSSEFSERHEHPVKKGIVCFLKYDDLQSDMMRNNEGI